MTCSFNKVIPSCLPFFFPCRWVNGLKPSFTISSVLPGIFLQANLLRVVFIDAEVEQTIYCQSTFVFWTRLVDSFLQWFMIYFKSQIHPVWVCEAFKEWRSACTFFRMTYVTATNFAFHCCALLLCHWLACQAVWIKLELSRFSWNSLHFPTHYVICHCQCCLTGILCKSCQSILLPSLLITTCNLYLNDIFHSKMDTN